MKLINEWRQIVRRAWSIRLILLAGALTGVETVITVIGDGWIPLPKWARMLLIMFVMGGAFVMRLVAQRGLQKGLGPDDQ